MIGGTPRRAGRWTFTGTDNLDEITARATTGDRTAQRQLYDVLSPRVAGYFAVRGAEDVEALTNDVFVQLLERITKFQGGYDQLRTFVFTIAHARLTDERRRRTRRPNHYRFEDTTDPRRATSAEDEALDRSGEAMHLLALLPERQQAVLVLRVLADLSIEQTAAATKSSASSVKKVQAKALAQLRSLMADTDLKLNEEGAER